MTTILLPPYHQDLSLDMADETQNSHRFRLAIYRERTHDDSVLPVPTETEMYWAGLFDVDELEARGMIT